ncbi:MAG TPA: hypothetical protein P5228_07430 [Bacteroidales bacterium]|nr:hypothetical protein [Bacteroidales bacterium]HRZ48684.1 hypothetical protein [Bacteroidales bacterium]
MFPPPFLHKWGIPFLIIAAVGIFNWPYIFVDYLYFDDTYWYFVGTEGLKFSEFPRGPQTQICLLHGVRDWFNAACMVKVGVPVTRAITVALMALTSLVMFRIYCRFSFPVHIALPAAIIPNILPGLTGIPFGVNASYAPWYLLPIAISILLIIKSFNTIGLKRFLLYGGAFLLYAAGLHLNPAANFMIPVVLATFLFLPQRKPKQLILAALPFLYLGLFQLFLQYRYSHIEAVQLSKIEMITRFGKLIRRSALIPLPMIWDAILVLILSISGVFGICHGHKIKFQPNLPHATRLAPRHTKQLLLWVIAWIAGNSFVYIAVSASFRSNDYSYVFNFGMVLLQVIGVIFILSRLFKSKIPTETICRAGWIIPVVLVLCTGIARLMVYDYPETYTSNLRSELKKHMIPKGSQIIVIGGNPPHPGIFKANSGFVRYLTGRNDLTALLGPESFPGDVFDPSLSWGGTMTGLDSLKPTVAFRVLHKKLKKVPYLLQVKRPDRFNEAECKWSLWSLSSGKPARIRGGNGFESLFGSLETLSRHFPMDQIGFAPGPYSNVPVTPQTADSLIKIPGLLTFPARVEDYFTLLQGWVQTRSDGSCLQLLVRTDHIPKEPFNLQCAVNDSLHQISLFSYTSPGDHFLIRIPLPDVSPAILTTLNIGFSNNTGYPWKQLEIRQKSKQASKSLKLGYKPAGLR